MTLKPAGSWEWFSTRTSSTIRPRLCYRRAHLLDAQSFRWLYYLGWVQAAQGRHEDAVANLRGALALKPDDVPAQLRLAESLLAIGQWEESRGIYQAISARASRERRRPLRCRAGCRPLARCLTAAVSRLPPGRATCFPQYGAAHYALAMVYRKLGRDERIIGSSSRSTSRTRHVGPTVGRPAAARGRADSTCGSVAHIRRGADLERAGQIDEAIAEQTGSAARGSKGRAGAHQPHRALWPVGSVRSGPSTTGLRSPSIPTRPIFTTTTACSS